MRKTLAVIGGTVSLMLALTACGSESDDGGVAQLEDTDEATAAAAAEGTDEEQALAFAQCMRDNGVDFADPTVDSEGNPSFENSFGEGGIDFSDESFTTAIEACGDLMEGLSFGGGGGGGGAGDFDTEAITEALYEYTSCLREEGLDVGDITLDGFGGGGGLGEGEMPADGEMPSMDPGAGPPEGVQGGAGGDQSDMYAEQLGQDPDSPEWIAANEVCQPLLEDLTAGFGAQGGAGADA